MKKIILASITALVYGPIIAQVTINADDEPRAILDIRACNTSNPEKNVGLIVPCFQSFPAVNPTGEQHSMIAFLSNTDTNNYSKNSFYFWDNNKTLWDQFLDEYTIEEDINKVVASGSGLYLNLNGTSTSASFINLSNSACYVYFTEKEALDPSYKLLNNHRLQIGKSGQYLLIMSAGLYKDQVTGIMTYTAEILKNGISFTPALTTSTTIAFANGRSGILALNALVDLNEGDDLIIKISRDFSTGNNVRATLNTPATIYLQRVKDNN
ncbi:MULTISPECIES: hypothetical protein [Dysgonomonas]|uniref:Cleaved adhesin domain-containing protein n=1 Tax=Dysgonomonas gadei ATCC BAA-286 TaxID=742766 RepID=F5IXC8_9BACT|nr:MULTISPECIES: hypothetical protein [Dysgonomonas]EGK02111.1 hypothetical protein HMPREF9455_01745 [Dysgonomonas gadei ATCC BAA-286]MBF0651873.1 hypothetical protein [Dysgonomonas sp. GY75]